MAKRTKKTKARRQRSRRIAQQGHLALGYGDNVAGSAAGALKLAVTAAGTLTLASALSASPAHALPQNGTVVGGSATISQSNATSMTINQSSTRTAINWTGFGIGANETVKFVQPGRDSIALNRVTGQDPSLIYGKLSSNGQVWVINPNGLLVGAGAQVQTGSFLASTMNIGTDDFMAGKNVLSGTPGSLASIINQGNIQVADGGYVVLAAPTVSNEGTIIANLGKVHLASGDAITLNFAGSDLIDLVVSDKAAADALGVKNSGTITADGGQVVLTARVATDLLKNVVNNEGIIQARSIVEKNGSIYLDGGENGIVANSGTLDASGKNSGETGGTVKLLGNKVGLFSGARVDASGVAGGGTVLIGGNFHGAGPEQNASMTYGEQGASVTADALTKGNGGQVAVWGNDSLVMEGTISAQGGIAGGDGGFVETSSHGAFSVKSAPNVGASNGKVGQWLIDPRDLTIDNASDYNVNSSSPFKPSGNDAHISWSTIDGGLQSGDVTVTTVGISGGSGIGDITFGAAGILHNGNDLTISAHNNIYVTNSLTRTASGNVTLNAKGVDISSSISLTGVSSLVLTASTGSVNQTAGTITVGTGGLHIDTNIDGSQAAGAVIAGSGALIKEGAGNFVLSGANTYSGGTTINAGTLTGTTSSLRGNIANNAALVFDQTTNGTYASAISGTGSVTKANSGNVTFSGANTYSGGTTISGGTLTGTTASLQGNITNNAALVFDQTTNGTYADVIRGAGSLTKTGVGIVTLSGANTYSGATTISNGTLAEGADNVLSNNTNVTVNGGTLDLAGHTDTVHGVLLVSGSIVDSVGAGVLTSATAYDVRSGTVSAALGGTVGLTKSTGGTVTLSGANTYGGGTNINVGTLATGADNALPSGTNVTVNGGTLDLAGHTDTVHGVSLVSGSIVDSSTVKGALISATDYDVQSGTVSAVLGGTVGLTKSTGGNVTLSGVNTYSRGTMVSGGTLTGTTTSLQGDIVDNAALVFDQATDGTYAGVISGNGSVTKSGAGKVTLSVANTYNGGTNVNGGTLAVGIDNALPSGTNVTVNGGKLDLAGYADAVNGVSLMTGSIVDSIGTGVLTSVTDYDVQSGTVSAALGGTVGLTKSTGGTVTLSGANTYSGGTNVNVGTLATGADNALPSGTNVTVNGGTLDLAGHTDAVNGVSLVSGSIVDSSTVKGALISATDYDVQSGTVSAALGGTVGLTKSTGGTVTLSGANTYSGGTTVSGGTLKGITTSLQGDIVDNAALVFDQSSNGTYAGEINGTGSVTKANSGNVTLSGTNTYSGGTTINGGTLTGTTSSLQGDIVDNAALVFDQATDGTFAGVISGTGSVTKLSSDNVTLSGANTYHGGTTISGGTLTGTTASLQGNIVDNAALVFDQTTDGIFAGVISGTGSVTKVNNGNVTLSGANTYSGGTTVNGGALTGTTASLQGSIVDNASLVFDQSSDGTYAGVISGTGSVTKVNSGNVTLSGANTYSGGTIVNGGTLTGTSTSLQGNIVDNASLVFDQSADGTFAGVISGTGSMTKLSSGNVTLSGANTYSGGTNVNGGTLTGTTTSLQGNIVDNAALVFDQTTDGTYAGTISGTGSMTKANSGNVTLSGANTYSGGTHANGGTLTGTTASLQGNIVDNATLVFDQSSGGTYAGVISGTGSVTKLNSGNVTLSGANTYSGGTTVSGGTLTGTTTSLQGDIVDNAELVFDQSANGTYAGEIRGTGSVTKLHSGNVTLSGANTYSGGTTISGGTLTGTTQSLQGNIVDNAALVFDQSADGTYVGVISGTGSVKKTNAANLTLAGANTYSGGTIIADGTLTAANSNALGSITGGVAVMNGATLLVDNVSLAAGLITLNGSGVNGGGALQSANNTTVSSDILLALDSRIGINNGNLTLSGNIDGEKNLTISGAPTTTLNISGAIGSGTQLSGISATSGTLTVSSIRTTGDVDLAATAGNLNVGVVDGNNVSMTGTTGIILSNDVTADGTLGLTTTNAAVVQTGGAISAGATTVTAGTGTVTLAQANNDFTTLNIVSSGETQITDKDALTVALNTTGTTVLTVGTTLDVSGSDTADLTVNAGGAVSQDGGVLAVGGTTTINAAGQAVILNKAGNDFSGKVTVNGAATQIADKNALTVALNTTGDTVLTAGSTLDISGTATADLTANAGGTVSQEGGVLAVGDTTTINAAGQAVTLNKAGNDFSGKVTVNGAATQITDKNGLAVALNTTETTVLTGTTVDVSGSDTASLTVNTTGAVSQTGGALKVGGTMAIDAAGQTVDLDNAANDFGGAVTVAGGATTLKDKNSLNVHLTTGVSDLAAGGDLTVDGASAGLTTHSAGLTFGSGTTTVTGDLTATATGAVGQTGVLTVTGASTINAGSGAVTLDNAGNDFVGAVTVASGTTTLRDANSLTAHLTTGATDLTAGGDLTVDGTSGNLTTHSAGLTFGATTVNGNLAATATGAVAQTGALSVTGAGTINSGSNTVTLDNAGNDFVGAVTVAGGATTLKDKNSLTSHLATGATDLTAGGDLAVAGASATLTTHSAGLTFGATTVNGDLAATATGAVSQTGALKVAGASTVNAGSNAVTLDNADNDFIGALTVTGGATKIVDANSLTGHLNTTDATALTAGSNLTVDGASGNLATNATNVTFGSGATTVNGDLAVTSAGAVGQSGALTVSGNSSIDAGSNAVTLDNAGNDFGGAVTVVAGTTKIADKNSLTAHLTTGATELTAGGDLIVDGNSASLTTDSQGLTFGRGATKVNGDLVATASGAVGQSGVLTVTGQSTINAGSNAVTLDNGANDFIGAVTVTGGSTKIVDANGLTAHLATGDTRLTVGGDLTVDGTSGSLTTASKELTFGATAVTGDLVANAGGAVGQSGALTVSGASHINAGGSAVTLDNGDNDFGGAVSVAGGATSIRDRNDLALGSLAIASNSPLRVVAAGKLTLPATAIDTGSADLFLHSGGTLSTAADLTTTTGNMTLEGVKGITVAHNLKSESGKIALNAEQGRIDQTGGIIATNGLLTTTSASGTALLAQNEVKTFNAVNGGSGNIEFADMTDLYINEVKNTGDVTLSTKGNMVISPDTIIGDTVTLTAKTIEGGSIYANTVNLNAETIGMKSKPRISARQINVHATGSELAASAKLESVDMSNWQKVQAYAPGVVMYNSWPNIQSDAPGVVLYKGMIAGGGLQEAYQESVLLGGKTINMAVNSKVMDSMLMLTSFEEFFSVAPNEAISMDDQEKPKPVQEFLPGVLPDGNPCLLMEEKQVF